MGQFSTYFYLIFHGSMQYSNIYSSQKKKFPVQVGHYIWKTIASAIFDENQAKKLALNLFQFIDKDLGPKTELFSPVVTSKTLLAFKFHSIDYFHFVVLVFSYSLKVLFMPILTICFTFLQYLPFFFYKSYNVAFLEFLFFWSFQLIRNFEWDLNVCLISPFEARACRDYILLWIENYLREYTESTINIVQVLILKVIGVNNLSKISNIF